MSFSILYVEDDRATVELLGSVLEVLCNKLYIAYNGEEGYNAYLKFKPDIIITDLQMPVLNGVEMINKIRLENESTPIYITSAYKDENLTLNLDEALISGIIHKPIDFDELIEIIEKEKSILFLSNL